MDIKVLFILVLAAIVLFQQCGGSKDKKPGAIVKVDGKKYMSVKHEIDTVYERITQTVVKKGKDIYHETIIHDTTIKYINIDTAALLRDYFAKNIYRDTILFNDSFGSITIVDTISQNKILTRTWNAKLNKITIKETTIVKELPKNQLYVGVNAGFNKQDFISYLGTGVILKTKKDKLYHIGAGVSNRAVDGVSGSLRPYVSTGMYWKIKLKN